MRVAFLLCLTSAVCWMPPVVANDLPVTGNRAAEEMLAIERGARTADPSSKAAQRLFSIIATKWRWPSGPLKVCFWNGSPERRSQVAEIANELVVGLPVSFEWNLSGNCPGLYDAQAPWRQYEIRVSLSAVSAVVAPGDNHRAFFGLIGSRASFDRPTTVNLPFAADTPTEEVRYRVLHEFCHALGCLHEHQRANCEDQFDRVAIMAKYRLNDAQYALNFAAIPEGGAYGPLAMTGFDRDSVMLYKLSPDMFRPGTTPSCLRDPAAEKLSPYDMAGLRLVYAGAQGATTLSDMTLYYERYIQSAALKRALAQGYSAVFQRHGSETRDKLLLQTLSLEAASGAAQDEAMAATYHISEEDRREAEVALALLEGTTQ